MVTVAGRRTFFKEIYAAIKPPEVLIGRLKKNVNLCRQLATLTTITQNTTNTLIKDVLKKPTQTYINLAFPWHKNLKCYYKTQCLPKAQLDTNNSARA